ncbi:MAG: hypothetical protein DHS80DRAFT_26197 [Piptocephalis tieghemiana]|nr:MAG: hypothetical protein DHS80DRAFT_26197 [Piptocephalis tieghemiana]
MALCGTLLLGIANKEKPIGYIPWKWTSSTWANVGFVCIGVHHVILSIVLVVNPRTSYGFRLFLQFAFFFFSHNCSLPYLFSLLSTKFVIIWQRNYQKVIRHRMRRILYCIPILFTSFIILIFLSGALLDYSLPNESEVVFRVAMAICMLGNLISACVCYVYGYRFARILSRQLDDMNRQVIVSRTRSPGINTPDHSSLPGPESLQSSYYNFEPQGTSRMAHTFMEARSILRMMGHINYLFVGVNITCLIIALLCLIFPVEIYTIPAFSKALFFFAVPNRIAFKTVLSVSMCIIERRRLQDRHDLQSGRVAIVERMCHHTNRYYELNQLQSKGYLEAAEDSQTIDAQSTRSTDPLSPITTVKSTVILEEGIIYHE